MNDDVTLLELVLSRLVNIVDVARAERVCWAWRRALTGDAVSAARATFWNDRFDAIIRPLALNAFHEGAAAAYCFYDGPLLPPPGLIVVSNRGPTLAHKFALEAYTRRCDVIVLSSGDVSMYAPAARAGTRDIITLPNNRADGAVRSMYIDRWHYDTMAKRARDRRRRREPDGARALVDVARAVKRKTHREL